MADFEADPAAMREYAQVVTGLHETVGKIDEYMRSTACDKSGFTGLFLVLRPVVDLVANLYGETLRFGHDRLTSLSQGITSAADAYEHHDTRAAKLLDELRAKLESLGDPAGGGVPDDFPTMHGAGPVVPDLPHRAPDDFPSVPNLGEGGRAGGVPEPGGWTPPAGTHGQSI